MRLRETNYLRKNEVERVKFSTVHILPESGLQHDPDPKEASGKRDAVGAGVTTAGAATQSTPRAAGATAGAQRWAGRAH